MRPEILHVSADFPDPIEPFKTPVIRSFLDLTREQFQHRVISINRVFPAPALTARAALGLAPVGAEIKSTSFEYGTALSYAAPGRGILHETMLKRLGDHIASLAKGDRQLPALIHGHKLTVEGLAVAHAAKLLGLPYSLTIQGNTDRKILRARPDLRARFRSIYRDAKTVFAFTPNARDAIEEMLGTRDDAIRLLPCPTDLDEPIAPAVTGGKILSVFHLKNWKVKSFDRLAQAAARLEEEGFEREITIIGGGSATELEQCKSIAGHAKLIAFAGAMDREPLRKAMNEAAALVVPSRSESFGLVFIEALFAGLPIIYPADTAIDGYFDGLPFALRVDAGSPEAIADAIRQAARNEGAMKAALADWQRSDDVERFRRPAIARAFAEGLNSAMA